METQSSADALTVWEAKERAGLLALETEEWREKRIVAEDPDTTGDMLARLTADIETAWNAYDDDDFNQFHPQFNLLAEAIAAHSNTPPNTLVYLLNLFSPYTFRALWRNSIAPFLCLETPDFWARMEASLCHAMLKESVLPPFIVETLARHRDKTVTEAVLLHVSLTGEVQTRDEGLVEISGFWREYCVIKNRNPTLMPPGFSAQEWHNEIVELGLAPAWVAGAQATRNAKASLWKQVFGSHNCGPISEKQYHPQRLRNFIVSNESILFDVLSDALRFRRPNFSEYVRSLLLASVGRRRYATTEFVDFVANLHGAFDIHNLRWCGLSGNWVNRLNAALKLPLNPDKFEADRWNRSPLDLLHHLAHDGNRLVRWAAQTRLADPDFTFTWHEGNE